MLLLRHEIKSSWRILWSSLLLYRTQPFNSSSHSLSSLSLATMLPSRFLLLSLLLILFFNAVHSKPKFFPSSSSVSSKIGLGYRVVSVEETPDGSLLARLQVKKPNKIYGPDIPYLQLFVKYVRVHPTCLLFFSLFALCIYFIFSDSFVLFLMFL